MRIVPFVALTEMYQPLAGKACGDTDVPDVVPSRIRPSATRTLSSAISQLGRAIDDLNAENRS